MLSGAIAHAACLEVRIVICNNSEAKTSDIMQPTPQTHPQVDNPLAFLQGTGEVRALMRACDWSATPLGPPQGWSSGLRATVSLMLTSRFAMWMAWGPALTFLCNDAYLPTVGLRRDWVIGSRSDKVWAEIWPDIGPRIEHVLATGNATWDEALLLYLERNGFTEETYHTFSYSPLADESGATTGMLCVVAEVTERVFGERQLATLRDIGTTLAAAPTRAEVMAGLRACLANDQRDVPFASVYLMDRQGGAERAALHDPAQYITSLPQHIGADDPAAPWKIAHAKNGEPALVDAGLIAPHAGPAPDAQRHALIAPLAGAEGERPVGYLIAGLNPHRVFDDAYRGFIGLLTAQVAAAVARADEYERARQRADALAEIDRAKTAFFSNVSHEFRTPLTLLLGPLEDALAAAEKTAPEQYERLDIAHRNALRLLRLVNSLLDFSRIEAGRVQVEYRPTDLAALTAELASSFRSATDKAGLALIVDTPALAAPVYVDRDMWEKIVLNLLSNAFKFTFEGAITVLLRAAEGNARLTVRDTGTGIPAEHLPKLFDRFHRVEGARGRSFEGSGIGLALVRELVSLHGGDIAVESEVGHGTAFHVTIPLGAAHLPPGQLGTTPGGTIAAARTQSFVEEALRWLPGTAGDALLDAGAARDVPQAGAAADLAVERRHVLLADDNADLRGYIGRLLAEHGYNVEMVADGEAALAALRARRPDILVTDVMMPGLDGFALLRTLREDPGLRDLPVVMLSARAGEESKVEGLTAGADDYLTKPFSARELLARVAANIAMARLRREAAEAVRASEANARAQAERVQLALDAGAIIGTWVWDVPANHFVGDTRFAHSFGLDPAQCSDGLTLEAVVASIHEDDKARVAQSMSEAMARGGAYRCEYRVRQGNGAYRWIEANGRVDLDARRQPLRFPGVLIDIEHRRAIEAALRDMNEQLENRVQRAIQERETVEDALRQAQKMEAVGQLTGGIAHDFNNLLTIVIGNVDMARRALANGEASRAGRAMDNAQKGAERAATLTQRLLAFSRRQPLAPKPLNVDRLVAGMGDLLQRALGETIGLQTVSSPGLWRVDADPNQLEAAILNLAVNARDAMPKGGKLTIETANAQLDQNYTAAHAEVAPGNYVVIAVTDTGHGMSKDIVAKALDPFFTTKEVGKGTGLGLSMVYGFVKQSGGHLKIYSEEGQGTTVKIYLPRLLSGEEPEEARRETVVDRFKRDQTILVVEDDDDVRAYTVEILRELGYRVLEAHDGPSALRLIDRQEKPVDLLFTDVVMPGMSGRELVDRAREQQPRLKVLYTSGYTKNAIVHGGRLDAGVELLPKPFTYHSLAEKIADVLDSGNIGRLLVVSTAAAFRDAAIEALGAAGFAGDVAATAAEATQCVRAAQGRYDAVLIDDALPDRAGLALAQELRAMYADVPLLIATSDETLPATLRGSFRLAKPFDAALLGTALNAVGLRRKA